MSLTPDALMPLTFLAVFAFTGVALVKVFGQDRVIEERLDELRGPQSMSARGRFNRSRRKTQDSFAVTLVNLWHRLLPGSEAARIRVAERFLNAGIYSPAGPSIFTGVRFVGSICLPIPLLISGWCGWIDSLVASSAAGISVLLGFIGTGFWLRSRITQRHRDLRRSLPDFLDLLGTCLQAGQSFEGALLRVTEELRSAHPKLTVELMIVQRDMTLGATPSRALRGFADRSGLDVLRQLATLVDQSQRLGASMTESLRIHAEMLRTHRSQQAETLAHKAGVKILLPTLLFIFPPVLVILAGPAAIDLHEKFVQRQETHDSQPKRAKK